MHVVCRRYAVCMNHAGVLLMATLSVFADNAFRLQCPRHFCRLMQSTLTSDHQAISYHINRLAFSWAFEFVACVSTFVSAAFVVWLVVLKARDDI